ncbi:MAG: A/G-specific adenine glycosylase [Deltaproteobacteria bacterium]|jgi:A/G-specific adenine glycosylase|nr:A/G-specific adenine glycosylase [Deltaproteobacteria bacterium]
MQPVFSLSPAKKKGFSQKLLRWFASAMRPLPWREGYDPYSVWISEIMLQQTQMERGVVYFRNWMRAFPDIPSVAAAGEQAVLKAWEGLGYYSRARNLYAAARMIVEKHGGEFPASLEAIRALPGIGEYTAGAIASIAFNLPEAAVDANVMRVFSRLCDIDVPLGQTGVKAFIAKAVRELMPEESPRLFSQALMEFGALVCAKKPHCAACPLAEYCEANRLGTTAKRPKRKKKKSYTQVAMSTGVVMRDGLVFIQKRPPYGLWAGLWEFPGGCLEAEESPESAVLREVMEETELAVSIQEKIGVFHHSYITSRVTMHAYFCSPGDGAGNPVLHAATEGKWVSPEQTAAYAFPAGHRKLLEHLGWGR